MTPMTPEQRRTADAERPYAICGRRSEGGCKGRLNVSHPYGRRIQERWMWFWCCEEHHTGKLKNTQKDKWIVLNQAGKWEFDIYPKCTESWKQELSYLNTLYGGLH